MKPKSISSLVLASAALLITALASGETKGDAVDGRALFEKRCGGCHALDRDKEGPRLAGVVGRKVGAVPGFLYSDPARKSAVVWTEATLDKWLADPDSVIPDSDMAFRVGSASERAAIIAYLKGTHK